MKVLAVNSSPKTDKGNTALILDPFLEGMRDTGAEVELPKATGSNHAPARRSRSWAKR